jgi:two-component sensor histidine kinase
VGVWKPETPLVQSVKYASATIMFPILMWITSLLVGLMAIQRQVIRPLRRLGRSMHDFADKRIAFRGDALNDSPAEIQQIAHTFHSVAFKLLHDEADLENRVFEREVLLKEVHHRVKNNLQLISSILNLQSRQATSKEARDALRTVQDRLSSLATVHRALYQTTELSNVRIDVLLESLFSQLLAIGSETVRGIKLTTDMDPVTLVPDQASPLAMLATEAFTNALKYSGKNRDGELYINVRLKQTDTADGADIVLELANSVSEEVTDQGAVRLGRKLIRTFSQQLGGTVEQSLENGRYVFVVTFPFEAFQPEDENA